MSQVAPHVSPDRIMQVGLGFWASKTLLSAIELGLFTALAEGPADLATLRQRLKLHPRATADFLDALVALGFLDRDGDKYRNTPEGDVFLDPSQRVTSVASSRWRMHAFTRIGGVSPKHCEPASRRTRPRTVGARSMVVGIK